MSVRVNKTHDTGLRDTNDSLNSPERRIRRVRRTKITDFLILRELGRGRHGRVCSAVYPPPHTATVSQASSAPSKSSPGII